jgi:hypothetical protein
VLYSVRYWQVLISVVVPGPGDVIVANALVLVQPQAVGAVVKEYVAQPVAVEQPFLGTTFQ